MDIRRLNTVWVILMLATGATWEVGEQGFAGQLAMALLLVLSFIKGRLVVLDFMGLRRAGLLWRSVLIGWLLLVSALIAIAYRIAQA